MFVAPGLYKHERKAFLPFLVWVGMLVFGIMATVKVNEGQWYTYPVTLRLVK